ncbi:MAG: tripartite tricarboxylate transporter TctB family protein [Pseudomonas sp.]|uniref:tripartite tricarboxylate transporter TctB family protein n=1 Tax=Pseudomonas sp. TaxID=306 RepID=UPI0033922256
MYVRLFSAAWVLLCVALAILAWTFKAPFEYDPVGPRAYPLLLLALMGAGALWLLCKPSDEATPAIDWPLARKVMLGIAALLAYALLFEPLGFVLSTALAGFGLGLLYNGRPLASAASGIAMGVLLYGLFDYLLDVPLPLGLLETFVEN